MNITYQSDIYPATEEIISLYHSSGLNRPIDDKHRIAKMYANSNLVVTAWDGSLLVGIARSLTDFCHCCYLADLAVRMEYQRKGIGKQLMKITKQEIGPQSMMLLLSAATAMEYYPGAGLEKVTNGFMLQREK
jgi:N-acetylglutamate synthase-like GNAT family acetyltransferase